MDAKATFARDQRRVVLPGRNAKGADWLGGIVDRSAGTAAVRQAGWARRYRHGTEKPAAVYLPGDIVD